MQTIGVHLNNHEKSCASPVFMAFSYNEYSQPKSNEQKIELNFHFFCFFF